MEEKSNIIIDTLEYLKKAVSCGHDKADKCAHRAIGIMVLLTVLMFVAAVFLGVSENVLPELLSPFSSMLEALGNLFGSSATAGEVINQVPATVPSDVPQVN